MSNTNGVVNGNGYSFGIQAQGTNNLIIKDNIVKNSSSTMSTAWKGGIIVYDTTKSYNVTISNNQILDMNLSNASTSYGIYSNAINTTVKDNNISNLYNGITLLGPNSQALFNIISNVTFGIRSNNTSINTIIANNTIFPNYVNTDVDNYGIYSQGNNTTIANNTILHNYVNINKSNFGIRNYGNNTTITNNIISKSNYGIYNQGNNIKIDNNTLNLNSIGIMTVGYGNISNNEVTNSNSTGIYISTSNCNLTNNTLSRNKDAIYLNGNNNSVLSSIILNNTGNGVLINGKNNKVNYNIIFNNSKAINNTITSIQSDVNFNWFGQNNISDTNVNVNISSYYILKFINRTRLDNLFFGDLLDFYLLVLNDTLDNTGVENLPFLEIPAKLNNGQIGIFNNTNGFILNFTVNSTGTNNVSSTLHNASDFLLFNVKINANLNSNSSKTIINKYIDLIAKLTDINGNFIPNKTVYFYIGTALAGFAITDNNGIAKLHYLCNNLGNFPVSTKFSNDTDYNDCNRIHNLEVTKRPTNIETNNFKGKTNASVNLKAKLIDKDTGNPIDNKVVSFYINGIKIGEAITNSNGVAILTYTPKKSGTYDSSFAFSEDDVYLLANNNSSLSITSIIPTNDSNKTKQNTTNDTNNYPTNANAKMKTTGIPLIAILLTLVCTLSAIIYRKN